LVDQREVVDRLERKGQDALDAILFLEDLEEIQEEYVAHRDRLERQVMRLVRPE
jgi:FtsZ-binding cell division protein ZapB